MILINLLPHREAKRRQRKQAFFVGLAAAAVLGLAVVGIWYAWLQKLRADQEARNQFLKAEIARLDLQIRDIATLKGEIEALKARQKAVEDLQTDRNTPVRLLDELVKQAPESVFYTSVRQNGALVTVNGLAQSNERVSELLKRLDQSSPWLERPELVEIKAVTRNMGGRDQRRLYEFSMRARIKQPAAPAAASAPAKAASAAAKSS
ncbi:MAG TPA: PilN domain-containing protein [Rubrivivax sp.]|nr:PilN domain-containing protein [Rubrivivax sp.]